MVDVFTVSTIVTPVSIVIGVIFALLELRHLTWNRRTEIIMKIYEQFGSREIVEAIFKIGAAKSEAFEDYVKKYGLIEVTEVAVLFEGVGVLLESARL